MIIYRLDVYVFYDLKNKRVVYRDIEENFYGSKYLRFFFVLWLCSYSAQDSYRFGLGAAGHTGCL
jgi:hypothetical protein